MSRKNTYNKNIFSKYRFIFVFLLIFLATLSAYWKVHNYDFLTYDDDEYVTYNHNVQNGLTLGNVKWAFTTFHAANWHPLTWLSHMVDCQIYGLKPGGHHITNLLFHIANSLILFFLFRKMTGQFWQSAFLASLFALHPLHVESVAWISERKDVLSTFFWFLTMWSYIRYVRNPGIDKYLPVLLFFVLGLMSKPMLVTLPFVLLLVDYYPLNRFHISASSKNTNQRTMVFRLILEKLPLFVLAGVSSAVTLYAQKQGGAVASLEVLPIQDRIANALVSYVSYILKMFYPFKLAVLYPHPGIIPWWQILCACLLLLIISFAAVRMIRKGPYFIVGWLWYLGTLVPVIGLVQAGSQSMADRYTYIPLIGLFLIISWGIPELIQRWSNAKKKLSITAIIILLILTGVTFKQAGYWKNSISLFEHSLRLTSNNYKAHNNLGIAYIDKGLIDDAIRQYEDALRIKPDYVDAHNNLGIAYKNKGLIDDAIRHFKDALRIKPDYVETHYNLGIAYKNKGLIDDSIRQYEEALRIRPDYVEAHNNLGIAYKDKGLLDDAIRQYKEALRIKPDYVDAHNNLGIALFYKRDINGAVNQFRKALQIDPYYTNARNNLNKVLTLQKQRQ